MSRYDLVPAPKEPPTEAKVIAVVLIALMIIALVARCH